MKIYLSGLAEKSLFCFIFFPTFWQAAFFSMRAKISPKAAAYHSLAGTVCKWKPIFSKMGFTFQTYNRCAGVLYESAFRAYDTRVKFPVKKRTLFYKPVLLKFR
jgi:hypothetical protein